MTHPGNGPYYIEERDNPEYGILEWRQCSCSVWPVFSPNYWGLRSCGFCGKVPLFPAAAPLDGKAHRLEVDDDEAQA